MRRIFNITAILAIAVLAPAILLAQENDDKAVAEQIATVLRDSGRMKNYSVGVKYRNGTVWLSGKVTSKAQMDAALQVVSDIEGLEQIVNNMEVSSGGRAGLKQPNARRTSYSAPAGADANNAGLEEPMAASGQVMPAGFHRLGAGHKFQRPMAMYAGGPGGVAAPAMDQAYMPNYAWPSYAAYPNYAALTYPKQYSPTAWPYIGPFYPYPQVPLGWRKVSLEWDDGWWFLDFHDRSHY